MLNWYIVITGVMLLTVFTLGNVYGAGITIPPPFTPTVHQATPAEVIDYKKNLQAGGYEFQKFTGLSKDIRGNATNVEVAAAGADVYVAMEVDVGGNNEIFALVSHDSARNFTGSINLSNDSSDSTDPQIGVIGENVYVVWKNTVNNTSNLVVASSMDGGRNFVVYPYSESLQYPSNSTSATKFVLSSTSPKLNLDGGYPILTWIQTECGNNEGVNFTAQITSLSNDTSNCENIAYLHPLSHW